ncbi:hypothetical protein L7F22_037481 [Adiantum nelumboides]|nr:hypothetical protein [Adiantum nelumboides]
MSMAMEELYPEELRTPPMPLAALVGLPELHSTISTYLHMEALPINILALPDFSKISVLAGKERKPADAKLLPPLGILKIDWLRKHRTRAPAALVVLLSRDEVCGDPAQWLQVCTHLDNINSTQCECLDIQIDMPVARDHYLFMIWYTPRLARDIFAGLRSFRNAYDVILPIVYAHTRILTQF